MIDRIGVLRKIEQAAFALENHIHNRERWFGKSGDQSGNNWGTESSLTPFRAISGNIAFGSDADDEALVLGTDDTPCIAGTTRFDPHTIMVEAASVATEYVIRVIYGTGTMADAETAGQYSDTMVTDAKKGEPLDIHMPRLTSGSHKVWVRIKNGTDNATMDFHYGIHEYER
ncbi:hypothetical protein LCGC14_1751110 [marine sediment metagenome]|uniref:Uncharacterized protein n=1 Tax=marine sediment metagenome TaxID=412755 RepID=A0A0F9H3X4_9ZZZZ